MKRIKLLLATACVLLTAATLKAQAPYTLTTSNQAYQALTTTNTLNNGEIWDEESYTATMPFNFKLGQVTTNQFNLMLAFTSVVADTSINALVNGFILFDADIADRGMLTGAASLSPIRYETTGTAPNRIFKAEIANAGFYNEYYLDTTMNDYVNMQVWLYETSNIFEIRYGASQVTSPEDYFNFGDGPFSAFVKNLDGDIGTWEQMFAVNGNPVSPGFDSVSSGATPPALTGMPVSGTVYRFTPKAAPGTGVNNIPAFTNVTVYPTNCDEVLNVNFKEKTAAQYVIVSADGKRTAVSGDLQNGLNTLNVSQLAKGNYLLLARNKDGRGVYRFTKQ